MDSALQKQIQKGMKLKKAQTNDRSAPVLTQPKGTVVFYKRFYESLLEIHFHTRKVVAVEVAVEAGCTALHLPEDAQGLLQCERMALHRPDLECQALQDAQVRLSGNPGLLPGQALRLHNNQHHLLAPAQDLFPHDLVLQPYLRHQQHPITSHNLQAVLDPLPQQDLVLLHVPPPQVSS